MLAYSEWLVVGMALVFLFGATLAAAAGILVRLARGAGGRLPGSRRPKTPH